MFWYGTGVVSGLRMNLKFVKDVCKVVCGGPVTKGWMYTAPLRRRRSDGVEVSPKNAECVGGFVKILDLPLKIGLYVLNRSNEVFPFLKVYLYLVPETSSVA